jgi:calcineurin-like phosphoesterase
MLPNMFEPAKGGIELQGVILDIDERTGLSMEIQRVKMGLQ